jgi:putative peptide zinc metalloprotease protein
LSGIYRIFVYTASMLFVADRFLLVGLIMAAFCVVSWVIVPLFRLPIYLFSNPRLARTRPRAIAVSLGTVSVLLLLLAICPFPNRFRAPGVLEAATYVHVLNEAPGYVKTVLVPTGSRVMAGTPLLQLSDEELDLEIAATAAQREETLALRMRAVYEATAELHPIQNRLAMIEKKLTNLQEQREALVVRAREKGIWVCPRDGELQGTWVARGSELGVLVNDDAFRFSAVVSQGEASRLFAGKIRDAQVRLAGESRASVAVGDYKFIPFQHETLPSAALGWHAGGDVPVSVKDETGLKAVEPFFQIYATLHRRPAVAFLHGRSGQIRFLLHPEPLLYQWARKFRQLLQKRYQI